MAGNETSQTWQKWNRAAELLRDGQRQTCLEVEGTADAVDEALLERQNVAEVEQATAGLP